MQSLEAKDWKNVRQPEFVAAATSTDSYLNISKQNSRQPENYVSQDVVLAMGKNKPQEQPVAHRDKCQNYLAQDESILVQNFQKMIAANMPNQSSDKKMLPKGGLKSGRYELKYSEITESGVTDSKLRSEVESKLKPNVVTFQNSKVTNSKKQSFASS